MTSIRSPMIRLFMTSGEAYDFYKIIKNETKTVGQTQKFDPEQKTQITKKTYLPPKCNAIKMNKYLCTLKPQNQN